MLQYFSLNQLTGLCSLWVAAVLNYVYREVGEAGRFTARLSAQNLCFGACVTVEKKNTNTDLLILRDMRLDILMTKIYHRLPKLKVSDSNLVTK
jgi:hypothetical protein